MTCGAWDDLARRLYGVLIAVEELQVRYLTFWPGHAIDD